MCGIIGYKGNNATAIAIKGLKRLEYRGYDSWGVAIKNDKIEIIKKVGMIGDFLGKLPESKIVIAHTRWATHGGVVEANSHPHTSCNGKIAVVHNGIVENYQKLKKELEKKGHIFTSETDSEVITHLIEEYRKSNNFSAAVMLALKQLEGNYAIVVIEEGSDTMIGARNGTPLVVGIKGSNYFMASDVPAFLEHTNKVVFMDDGEMVITDKNIEFIELEIGKSIEKKVSEIKWNISEAQKGNFPHFMIKEIMEQEESLRRTLNQDETKLLQAADMLNKSKEIIFVACGTAYHASLLGSQLLDKRCLNVIASEFNPKFVDYGTLIVAVSQSGETADVISAVKAAKGKGAKILSLINAQGSSLERMSDIALPLHAGPEIAVASTKAFTSQVALLSLLAFACKGKISEGKLVLEKNAKEIGRTINDIDGKTKALAERLDKEMFIIGRGLNLPIALEAALKIKEVSYVHAEGLAGGELKHGTLALIEKGTPCIVFFSNDKQKQNTLSNATEIKARGGYIIGIGPENNEIFNYFIEVPDSIILNAIPAQLLAYHIGVKRGCDIDHCRNLAKSVTVK